MGHKGVDTVPEGFEDEARDALLAKAVQAWEDDPALDAGALGDGSEDSVSCYLRAYYQRVATEDLAPPSRLAAAAQAHATSARASASRIVRPDDMVFPPENMRGKAYHNAGRCPTSGAALLPAGRRPYRTLRRI